MLDAHDAGGEVSLILAEVCLHTHSAVQVSSSEEYTDAPVEWLGRRDGVKREVSDEQHG